MLKKKKERKLDINFTKEKNKLKLFIDLYINVKQQHFQKIAGEKPMVFMAW